MATRIEMLKQAGFSDAEIGDWATAERQRLRDAGFTGDEIDAEFGVTRPPTGVPEAFIERLKQGNAAERIAGASADYAQRYFGDAPLGFSERHQDILRRLGVAGDLIIPAAKPVDALLRAVPAGIAGLGAGIGQAVEETIGPGSQAKGKTARDFAELAGIAALLSGTGPRARAPAARTASAPVAAAPAIVLPRAEDFRAAAAAISGTSASFPVEQKLLRLWTEHGIHPAEVVQDAMRDRTVAAELVSDSGKLPVGAAGETAATPAEHGAQPRPATPGDRPAVAESPSGAIAVEERLPARVEAAPEASGPLAPEPAPRIAASRDINMFPPPQLPQRPFRFDYRLGATADESGRLLEDMEGRPLVAKYVAGRRSAGGPDVALTTDEMKKALMDLDVRLVEIARLPLPDEDTAGVFAGEMVGRRPVGDLYVKSTNSGADQVLTMAHEFGHAIDHYARYFSDHLTADEIAELRKVYATLRGGKRKTPVLQPESFGYPADQINGELVAEGFRAYLTDPNWFKVAAPKSAAKFRAAVNKNRWLKNVIQFNSLDAAGLLSAGLGTGDQNDQ
jgi:hypothetical protein